MLDLLRTPQNINKKLSVIIDGEHYPQINLDAIRKIEKNHAGKITGLIFIGGTEKLIIDDLDKFFGYRVFKIGDLDSDLPKALKELKPEIVYDLSDEPSVNYEIRMKVASFCLAEACSYMGPDFYFEYEPKHLKPTMPSLLIIGTGKRIGKTAVSSYIANILNLKNKVVTLAMGRGGPPEPEIICNDENNLTPEYLLEISRSGKHASSDYIEDALFSSVTTVGCRRCGGGFGGKFFLSNIDEGMVIVERLNPEILIVESSGASVPPVKAERTICVLGADQEWASIVGYLGIYRILISDLIFLTMCEDPIASKNKVHQLIEEIFKVKPDAKILKSVFRPKPLYSINNKRVFLTMTAKKIIGRKISDYLEKQYNCKVVKLSFNLANRTLLKKELSDFNGYDVLLTELKASSVDLVTEFALSAGKEINYLNNIPVIIDGKDNLDNLISGLENIENV